MIIIKINTNHNKNNTNEKNNTNSAAILVVRTCNCIITSSAYDPL